MSNLLYAIKYLVFFSTVNTNSNTYLSSRRRRLVRA